MDELSQLIEKLNDLENDITSLQIHEVETVDEISESIRNAFTQTCLQLYVVQSREPMTILKHLLWLEVMHGSNPPYKPHGLYYIKSLEIGVARLDAMTKYIDTFINAENKFKSISHSSFIIMSDKLKGYTRESKRLLQKIAEELETTIRVLKTNESIP